MAHTASSQPAPPTWRAMSAETMKMPDPIIDPATSIVESNSPSPRTNVVCSRSGAVAASGIEVTPLRCHERAHFFAHHNFAQVVRLEEIKDNDGHFVVHAQREGCGVHDLQLLLQSFEVGELVKRFAPGFFFGSAS